MSSIVVSAIIPFLNEEKLVAKVVKELLKHPDIDEIICINDGSTDDSMKTLEKFKKDIILVNLKTNHGKGFALAQGIKKAKGEIVIFFDADLTNLTQEHIDVLLTPLRNNTARCVLGYSTGGYFAFLFKKVTGERAYFRKDLLPYLKNLEQTTRFSAEYYLNSLFAENETIKVPLHKLVHLLKHEKYTPYFAMKENLKDINTITRHKLKKINPRRLLPLFR